MRLWLLALLLLSLFTLSPSLIFAQNSTTSSNPRERLNQAKEQLKVRQENIGEKRAALGNRLEATRAARREVVEEKRAKLKEQLKKIKDERKAQIAEKINDNLARVNQTLTGQWLKHLDKMNEILSRLEKYVSEANIKGKDTIKAKAALEQARQAIEEAKTAVQNQADKDYTLTISGEKNLGPDVKAVRDKLHADLKATQETVKAARKALSNTIMVTRTALGGSDEKK